MRTAIALAFAALTACVAQPMHEAQSQQAAALRQQAAQIESLLFDVCPRVVSGEVDLSNPNDLEKLGLRSPRVQRERWINAETGSGDQRIGIGYADFRTSRVCQVRFGGRNNAALARAVVTAGLDRGWRSGEGPSDLGGFVSFLHKPDPGDPASIMFTHWDEFDGLKPATNVGLVIRVGGK